MFSDSPHCQKWRLVTRLLGLPQLAKGRYLGVAYGQHEETCAVRAVKKWIERRGEKPGPLFSGFVTAAGQAGLSTLVIAAQTGHKSLDSLKHYFHSADLFKGYQAHPTENLR